VASCLWLLACGFLPVASCLWLLACGFLPASSGIQNKTKQLKKEVKKKK
jgi:hypothetical protein